MATEAEVTAARNALWELECKRVCRVPDDCTCRQSATAALTAAEKVRQRMDRDFREMQGLVDLLTKARLRAENAEAEAKDAREAAMHASTAAAVLGERAEKAEAELDETRKALNNASSMWLTAAERAEKAEAALREAAAIAENEGVYFAGLREGAILARVARNILALIDKPQEDE